MANVTKQINVQKGQDKSSSQQTGTSTQLSARKEEAFERKQSRVAEPVETSVTRPAQTVTTTQKAAPTTQTSTEDYAFTLTFSLIIKEIPCSEIP